jgi:phenylalanyl-tRNA synthetase beta chain
LVGVSYSTEQISRTLTQIGCQVAEDSEAFQVTPPSWRPDLKHKTDLVEEVARLNGYQQIPSVIPVAPPGAGLTPRQQLRRRVVSALANSGLVEILNYPFVSIEELQQFDAATGAIRLENPMQEESAFLRTTLLPGLLSAAARNQSRAAVSLQVFEEGSVFLGEQLSAVDLPTAANRPSDEQIDHLESLIPDQPRLVSAVLIGDIVPQGPGQAARPADYSDAITAVKQVVAQASMQTAAALRFVATSQDGWHPGRTAEIWIGQNLIGVAGELHPDTVDRYHLKGRAAAFEIDLDQLFAAQPRELVAAELRIMPAATQDLTLIVPESVSAAELSDAIVEGAGELLESQSLIDIYRGAPLSANQKSITFALVFRATDRTLTQAEASEARDAAVALTAARFGAELRS